MASPVISPTTALDAIGGSAMRLEHDPADTAPRPTPAVPAEQPDLRLIIEEDKVSGSFVYKTMDRRTGEVVRQFPREEVLKLKDAQTYDPGAVFRGLS